MKTSELVSQLVSGIKTLGITEEDKRPQLIASQKLAIEKLFTEKQLSVFEANAKLGRLEQKVVNASLEAGLTPPAVHNFLSSIGFRKPPVTDNARETSKAETIDAKRYFCNSSFTVFETSTKEYVQVARQDLLASDSVFLRNLVSEEWALNYLPNGHIPISSVTAQDLRYVAMFLSDNKELDYLTPYELREAHKAADFIGSDKMISAVNRVYWNNSLQLFSKPGVAEKILRGLGEPSHFLFSEVQSAFEKEVMNDTFSPNRVLNIKEQRDIYINMKLTAESMKTFHGEESQNSRRANEILTGHGDAPNQTSLQDLNLLSKGEFIESVHNTRTLENRIVDELMIRGFSKISYFTHMNLKEKRNPDNNQERKVSHYQISFTFPHF